MKINIGITDDHQLLLKSLCILLESFPSFTVVLEATNGEILLQKLEAATVLPDIILIDVNMPVMNGIQAAAALSGKYPQIKLVALSMRDDDSAVIGMIGAGCCAYLLKDIHPNELEKALLEVYEYGFRFGDVLNEELGRVEQESSEQESLLFSDRQLKFLKLASTELTYRQIADKMQVSEVILNGYREQIFERLQVKSRIGMVLEAVRRSIIDL